MDARRRYDEMLTKARARGEVQGPLGIPGWKPISKATRKWLIANGKLDATVDNLKKAAPKAKAKVIARATATRVGTSPAIPPGMSKEDLAQIMQRHKEKGMIVLK